MSDSVDKPAILYCGSFEIPNGNASANRFEANAAIFSALDYEVVGVGFHREDTDGVVFRKFTNYSAYLLRRPAGLISWMLRSMFPVDVFKCLRKMRGQKIDFCILYDFPSVASLWVYLIGFFFRFRVILEITEWYNRPSGVGVSQLYKTFDTWMRIQLLCRLPVPVMVASPYLKGRFQKTGNRVLLLPSLHVRKIDSDIDEVSPSQDSAGIRFTYAGMPFNIVDGRVDPSSVKERLDVVVELLSAVRQGGIEVSLDVLGVESDVFFSHYTELKLNECEWIKFHGEVEHSVVLEFLQKTDFTIFFREETRHTLSGFPSKFSESIVNGVPVVTNYLSNMEGFYSEDTAVVFPDFDSILEDRKLLIGKLNPGSVENMKQGCRRAELFFPESYVEDVRQFLESH